MSRFLLVTILGVFLLGVPISGQAQFWRRAVDAEPPPVGEEPTEIRPSAPDAFEEPAAAAAEVAAPAFVSAPPAATRGELVEKRAMYRLRDQETVDALVRLAAGRQLREQELVVVSRLIREKEMELAAFDERLQQQFGISPTGNYHYDNERRIIFALQEREEAGVAALDQNDPLAAFEKRPLRRLRDEEAEQHFLRLVGAKKITSDQIRALQLIVQEKRIELSNILDSLREQFSMDADKHYEYDAETRVVYELIYEDPAEVQSARAAP